MKSIRTNTSYNHSHKIKHKSEAKHWTRTGTPDTIFSDKRQATSDKRQATSNKQQATSDKRHKSAVCPRKFSHTTIQFYSKQPWFSKGGCVPLKPPAFCRGKERHLSDASFPLSPYDPLSPFQRCQRGHPFGNPIRKQKGIQTKISKELRLFKKIYTIQVCVYRKLKARLEPKADRMSAGSKTYEFFAKQKLEAQECTRTYILGRGVIGVLSSFLGKKKKVPLIGGIFEGEPP